MFVPGKCLQFSLPDYTKMRYLPSAPLKGKLLAFSTFIGLSLARDKLYRLLGIFVNYARKKFYSFAPSTKVMPIMVLKSR